MKCNYQLGKKMSAIRVIYSLSHPNNIFQAMSSLYQHDPLCIDHMSEWYADVLVHCIIYQFQHLQSMMPINLSMNPMMIIDANAMQWLLILCEPCHKLVIRIWALIRFRRRLGCHWAANLLFAWLWRLETRKLDASTNGCVRVKTKFSNKLNVYAIANTSCVFFKYILLVHLVHNIFDNLSDFISMIGLVFYKRVSLYSKLPICSIDTSAFLD